MIAHTVDGQPPFLRGRIDHIAAGTHAEAVHAPAVFCCMGQLVAGCRKLVWTIGPVLGCLDHGLGMLDAHAHSKSFRFHMQRFLPQHFKRIPGTVPDGQHRHIRRCFFLIVNRKAGQLPVRDVQICHLAEKAHLTAQGADFFSQILDHFDENVGANMGLVHVQNLLRRPCFGKNPQYLPVPAKGILHQRIQFSIRKRPGAAFSELGVGPHIQCAACPELLQPFLPLRCRCTPFQKQRRIPGFCQQQATEQSCRAAANDHWPVL